MARILFAPKQDHGVTDIARALTPPGFELVAADFGTPEFYAAAADAEYFLGLARNMGTEFFRSAPKLKLVQLLSAGYDNLVYNTDGRSVHTVVIDGRIVVDNYRQAFVEEARLFSTVQEIGERLQARTGITFPRSRWPIS